MAAKRSFDLTPVMAPYFDNHMIIPLLDFVRESGLYEPIVIAKEKIRTLTMTNLIDVIEDEYVRYPDDKELAAEFASKKTLLDDQKNASVAQCDTLHPNARRRVSQDRFNRAG